MTTWAPPSVCPHPSPISLALPRFTDAPACQLQSPNETSRPTHRRRPKGHKAAVAASFLGWTLDAFDFFLVTYTLTTIAKDFGVADKAIVFSLTLTLMFRPVGALLFGLLADRIGRKKALMANLLFFSVVEVATGFAHTYTSSSFWRALFGIGMGGEWGVGSSLAMEKAPKHRRGICLGTAAGRLCGRQSARGGGYFFVFPRLGLARDVLHRRHSGAARALRAHVRQGIRGVGAAHGVATSAQLRARGGVALEAVRCTCSCSWR